MVSLSEVGLLSSSVVGSVKLFRNARALCTMTFEILALKSRTEDELVRYRSFFSPFA